MPPKSKALAHSISFRTCMVHSDYPSVWGWKAVLNFNFVPKAPYKLDQNRDANLGLQSDMIDAGIPCNLTTSLIYSSTNLFRLKLILMGIKCANFVSRSIITQTASFTCYIFSNFTTKSIVMCSHFHSGISKDYNNPVGCLCPALIYWQVKHFEINSAMSLFIHLHQ